MTGGAEFAHLPEDLRPIALLDAETRIAHIRSERWIQNAPADRLLGYLSAIYRRPLISHRGNEWKISCWWARAGWVRRC